MLPRYQDAYGQAIYDHFLDVAGDVVIERSDGYVERDAGMHAYFSTYDEWPPHVRSAWRAVKGRVLDIGCGAGRHALRCQRQDLAVTAIDQSPLAIKTCRARGVRDARVMSVTGVSKKLGLFDTVLMLGHNFGLFGSAARTRWLLRRLNTVTTPGACIVAECLDPYQTDDPHHLDYHGSNLRRGRMPGQLRLRVRYKTQATPWFDYLFVSRDEMSGLLEGTGWRIRRFIKPTGVSYIGLIEKE